MYTDKSLDPNYNETMHKDYCDIYLLGCTQFGFHPKELIHSLVRFDMLHLRCSVTKKIAKYLMNYLRKQHTDVQGEIEELLLTF